MGGRIAKLAFLVVALALVLPAAASAQSIRTWVSGTGNDASVDCSRTQPCATMNEALDKTIEGGRISAIDSGRFAPFNDELVIDKAITIDFRNVHAGFDLEGSGDRQNGIRIHAGTTDKVVLRGLQLNGMRGVGVFDGTPTGIRIVQARSVRIEKSTISQFEGSGLLLVPTGLTKLIVTDTTINDNLGAGLLVAPPVGGNGRVTLKRAELDDNRCGAAASSHPLDPGENFTVRCGTLASGAGGAATISSYQSSFADNQFAGILSNGPFAVQRISKNEIFANSNGLQTLDGGAIISYNDNVVTGNSTDGSPTSTAPFK